eukprot:TRINITY_DN11146_c0_g1_i1.p1 TRINITY_DN11146_c0_g1~~TRINITY_DN11146_c0_g1_i1.p1  ORF type:complete len:277 (-),score=39.32 TRINITY_DN11146_c0_g1_i1:29-859(-)
MTTPQQIILRGSPHVNRFSRNHPMSHGSKKTRDEPKQHIDIDPYPYPSGKTSKKSKAYTNVKEALRKIADGFRPNRSKSTTKRSASDETLNQSPSKVQFKEPYEEIGYGSPFGEIIESLHPSEHESIPATDLPASPNAPTTASTTVAEEMPILEQIPIISKGLPEDASDLKKIPDLDISEISPTLRRHKQEVVDMINELKKDHMAETNVDDDIIAPSQLSTKYAWLDPPLKFDTAAFEEKFLRIIFTILLIPFMILQYLFHKMLPKGFQDNSKKRL